MRPIDKLNIYFYFNISTNNTSFRKDEDESMFNTAPTHTKRDINNTPYDTIKTI